MTQPAQLGRYDVVAEIGRGAMGVVYRAVDPMLERTVAIKTINMALDPGEMSRFDDLEARPIRLSSQDIPTPYNGTLENLTIIQPHQIVAAAKQLHSGQL